MQPSDVLDPEDGRYEELLGLWADLESGLSLVLAAPDCIPDLERKIGQYDSWMRGLLEQDTDIALYLLFQLAGTSTTGYSASHALVCAVLCHVSAIELKLPDPLRNSLVRAALSMNIAITQLQDELAQQSAKLSETQQALLLRHGERGAALLRTHGVTDPVWLELVTSHHDEPATGSHRLTRLLWMIDRYAAMISPRKSRSGRSASESLRAVVADPVKSGDRLGAEFGDALMRAVGLCPPGTLVRLESGEIGVVLRRGTATDEPAIAILTDGRGRANSPPRLLLRNSESSASTIEAALPCSVVELRLHHRTMIQLGLFASRQRRRAVTA